MIESIYLKKKKKKKRRKKLNFHCTNLSYFMDYFLVKFNINSLFYCLRGKLMDFHTDIFLNEKRSSLTKADVYIVWRSGADKKLD